MVVGEPSISTKLTILASCINKYSHLVPALLKDFSAEGMRFLWSKVWGSRYSADKIGVVKC